MKRLGQWFTSFGWNFWVVWCIGLALRLWLAWQPIPDLIKRYNADDMYYYLTIARQIATGHGVSFDGIAPTNGFHPLYLVVLVVLTVLTAHATALNVYLALTFLCIVNAATAIFLFELVRRVSQREAAFLAALVWLFNPYVILATLDGVESALAVFFLTTTLLAYIVMQAETEPRRHTRDALNVGLLAGLTVLARMDGILLVAALIGVWVWNLWRKKAEGKAQRVYFHKGVYAGAACAVLVAPWLIWNLLNFGTAVQVSGTAIAYDTHYDLTDFSSTLSASIHVLADLMGWVLRVNFQITIVALLAAMGWVAFRRGRTRVPLPSQEWRLLWFLILYALFWFAFYGVYFLHRQLWYLLPMMLVGTLGGIFVWDYAANVIAGTGRGLKLLLRGSSNLIVVMLIGWWFLWQSLGLALYPAQYDGYRAALWLRENTPPTARIGAWNSGIIGYFSERAVVNLDGVVNNPLTQHVVAMHSTFHLKDIWNDIRAEQITFLTDYEQDRWREIPAALQDSLKPVYQFESSVYPNFQVTVFQVVQ